MSAKDSMAKEYFADNARFADLCNNILYGGREVILPENLKERDTTEVLTALGLDKKTIAMQKMRDIFKNASIKYTGKSYVVLIGVENQSDIHYAIPVKNMFYDVMAYGNQVKETAKKHRKEKDTATSDEFLSGFTKEDKLIPVITITVYLGTKEWDGPRKLSDMFGDVDEELLPFIPDYRINLLAPREITDFTGFRTSIRQLFEVLKNAYLQIENGIMDAVAIEKSTNTNITELTVGSPTAIDVNNPTGEAGTDSSSGSSSDSSTTDSSNADSSQSSQTADGNSSQSQTGDDSAADGSTSTGSAKSTVTGYQLYDVSTVMAFKTEYHGLKAMLGEVIGSSQKKTISTLNVSFDDSTGKLTGEMLVDSYFLYGLDKPYEAPYIPAVPHGTNNLFGTTN